MRVLFFDGQGSASTQTPASNCSLKSPLSTLFVRQANALFSTRVKSLPFDSLCALERGATRSLLSLLRDDIIQLPVAECSLLCHPLISLPSLYVAQVIRLFEELESILKAGFDPTSVVGYSSGLLPALLVATSFPSSLDELHTSPANEILLLQNAIALFEVAISIGIESQIAKGEMLSASGIAIDDPTRESEWSAVIFGETRDMLEEKLDTWNNQAQDPLFQVYITAQTTATCHTISSFPSSLKEFLSFLNHPTSQNAPSGSASPFTEVITSSPSLSRKSSVISFQTSTTSPCLSPIPRRLHLYDSSIVPTSVNPLNTPRNNYPTSTPNSPSPTQQMYPAAIKKLKVFSLFHTKASSLRSARDRVLANIFSPQSEDPLTPTASSNTYNKFQFNTSTGTHTNPNETLKSLRLCSAFPLYDMGNGSILSLDFQGRKLIERIVDLILLERVEFALVLDKIEKDAEKSGGLEIVNIGPGTGLARTSLRVLKDCSISSSLTITDLSVPSKCGSEVPPPLKCQEPIAIVGMAVNFPGTRNAKELWHILEQGINTVTEIPESRFSVSSFTSQDDNSSSEKYLKTRFGCFLPEGLHSGFDNTFFRISPREARALDPQMRLLMRVGLQAAESAGLVVKEFSRGSEELSEGQVCSEDIGCFVGVATNDYVLNSRNEIGVHYATGTLPAFLAGRLAYALHLSGPSVVTNTACSSSLVAIHQACRALLMGDCKAALAGGVNVITSPEMYSGLDRSHFLSSTGNCKPWDVSADGYCRAEGSGMFVLKRLSDALASSDNILGVIRGSEINQSAAAVSITRPHGPTQEKLFESLIKKASIRPEDITLVEAHGTGTQAGDPEELKSIRNVLSPNGGTGRDISNQLTVTSIKANIGHTEAASGAASLAKVLLMLQHRSIPSQIGLVSLNPSIEDLTNDFTRINTSGSCIEWSPSCSNRRIALINNFGAAGSNAAILVEEAPAYSKASRELEKGSKDHVLIAISAEKEEALLRLRDSYVDAITESSFVNFGYTATSRRKVRPWRMVVSSDSVDGVKKALENARPTRVSSISGPEEKIVFVFSGQGAQHIGMGRQLYVVSSRFREFIDSCHEKLVDWGYPGVLPIVNSEARSELERDSELVAFQCAVFVIECALCNLFTNWGLNPSAVVGHSLGEYAALVAADVVTLDTGLRLVARRALLMSTRCQKATSGMLAIRLQAQTIRDVISRVRGCSELKIACYNGTKDIVVGGPITQLSILKVHLERSGTKCISIDVPFAYHTDAMEPILADFENYAKKFTFKAPKIPIVSNVLGCLIQPGDDNIFSPEYLAKHCRLPVRFDEGIGHLAAEMERVGAFIELGPHPTTTPMLTHVAASTGAVLVHSLNKKTTARASIFSSLSQIYLLRKDVKWGNVYRDLYPAAICIDIPSYPLSENHYWIPYVGNSRIPHGIAQEKKLLERFSFLESWTQKPSSQDGNISEFETPIEKLSDHISGHRVVSFPLCPASVYYELAMSAAVCTLEFMEEDYSDLLTLSELQFSHPLVLDTTRPLVIRTTINLHPRGGKYAGTFSISSILNGREQHQHCTGFFQRRQKDIIYSKLQLHSESVERSKHALLNPVNGIFPETLRTRTIYDIIFSRVVKYSKLYQVINSMTLDETNGKGFAIIRLPSEQLSKNYVSQPVFIDSLIHAAGFLINSRARDGEAFICNQVDSSKVVHDVDYSKMFEVYCSTVSTGDNLVLTDVWAVEIGEKRRVIAHLKRMRFSRLRVNSLQKLLSSPTETVERKLTSSYFKPSLNQKISTTATPAKLGSPFRPSHRSGTPSSASSITVVNGIYDIAAEVINLLAVVCGISENDISLSSDIVDLGVDSLIWIELSRQLKSLIPGLSLGMCELMSSRTVNELVHKISKLDPCTIFGDSNKTPGDLSPPAKLAMKPTNFTISRSKTSLNNEPNTSHKAKEIFGNILNIPSCELHDGDTLDSLGLDSLGSIEAMNEIQQQFHISLPCDFFRNHRSIHAVQRYITNSLDSGSLSRYSSSSTLNITDSPVHVGTERSLFPIQDSVQDSRPLFLVHDGSGLSNCYSRLGCVDRPLWGINNPKLFSEDFWAGGIAEMAENYIKQMKPVLNEKGCVLGGWSFGGVVAFHMACELIRAGIKVSGVVLIDSPSPFSHEILSDDLINSVIHEKSHSNVNSQQTNLSQLARKQMSYATRALIDYDPLCFSSNTSVYPNVVMLRCEDSFISDCSPKNTFLEDRDEPEVITCDWEKLIGKKVPILDIPGHHFEPFSPKNVSAVTRQLKRALEILDASN